MSSQPDNSIQAAPQVARAKQTVSTRGYSTLTTILNPPPIPSEYV